MTDDFKSDTNQLLQMLMSATGVPTPRATLAAPESLPQPKKRTPRRSDGRWESAAPSSRDASFEAMMEACFDVYEAEQEGDREAVGFLKQKAQSHFYAAVRKVIAEYETEQNGRATPYAPPQRY